MQDKFFNSRKAQTGTTTTWIVATLIIIVVLGISIAAVNFAFPGKKNASLVDKEKDFLATKSITSFLSKKENVDLLKSGDKEKIELKMKRILYDILGTFGKNPGAWNLELEKDGKKTDVDTYNVIAVDPISGSGIPAFETNLNSNEIKLKFWKECQGICG